MVWRRPQPVYLVLLAVCTFRAITATAVAGSTEVTLSRPGRVLLQQQLQCGGMTNCGAYDVCTDEQWPKYACPAGNICNRQNKWYWLCIPGGQATTRQPIAPAPASPWWPSDSADGAQAPASSLVVSTPITGTTADNSTQEAPWQLWWCKMEFSNSADPEGYWSWMCAPSGDTVTPPPALDPGAPTIVPIAPVPTTPAPAPAPAVPPTPVAPAPTPTPAPALTFDSKPLSKPIPLTGTNSYFLLTWSADAKLRPAVLDTLDGAVTDGFKVIRIWAFADSYVDNSAGNSLQPKPGVYNATVLAGLDWLLQEANKRGLQFMMTLTNSWPDYGGIRQYVRWANGLPDTADVGNREFFYNKKALGYYRDYAKFMVTRYRGNPTVHSWDICNQPRADGDKNGAVAKWVAEAAAFVKSLDNKHPVTVGLDGFFGPSTPDLLEYNPYDQDSGNDLVEECKHVDFCSFHMYPNNWRSPSYSAEEQASWAVRWIDGHIIASQKYLNNKPVLLTEYSIKPAGVTRDLMFQKVADRLVSSIKKKEPFAGAMVWWLASPKYAFDDGYAIRPNENSKQRKILTAMNAAVLAAIKA